MSTAFNPIEIKALTRLPKRPRMKRTFEARTESGFRAPDDTDKDCTCNCWQEAPKPLEAKLKEAGHRAARATGELVTEPERTSPMHRGSEATLPCRRMGTAGQVRSGQRKQAGAKPHGQKPKDRGIGDGENSSHANRNKIEEKQAAAKLEF